MARSDRKGATEQAPLTQATVKGSSIYPNPWNVNEMSPQMFEKEIASIREFGFVDPLLVRPHPWEKDVYQIIDGEHRWSAGTQIGMTEFPVNIIEVDDDTAKQLSIVLNETRGSSNQARLSALVRDLASRDPDRVSRVMPFDRARLDEMLRGMEDSKIDFDALREKHQAMNRETGWVERVFRMPSDSATVVDDALGRIMRDEGIDEQWKALEMMAADSLAGA